MNAQLSRPFVHEIFMELRKSDNLLARSAARDLAAVCVLCDDPFTFTKSGLERIIHALGLCATPESGLMIKRIVG